MVAYNFKPRFVSLIERGQKTQTIRPYGKRRHAQAGDTLHLYTGARTPLARLILPPRPCILAGHARITRTRVCIDGERVRDPEGFALRDGFEAFDDMTGFFDILYDLPFEGWVIRWEGGHADQT